MNNYFKEPETDKRDQAVAIALGYVECDDYMDINMGSAGGPGVTIKSQWTGEKPGEHEHKLCWPSDPRLKWAWRWSSNDQRAFLEMDRLVKEGWTFEIRMEEAIVYVAHYKPFTDADDIIWSKDWSEGPTFAMAFTESIITDLDLPENLG